METMKEMYAEAGEFYDVVSDNEWKVRRKAFQEILMTLTDVDGDILDIGSGTGHGVVAAAEVLPDVDIFAVEPSPTMRTALLSRIMQTENLRQRVTVIPSTFETAEIPERLRAVLFLGCIGFMDDKARHNFWEKLAPHMTPGGIVLFDVMMINKPKPYPKMHLAEIPVGHNIYHVWLEGIPDGDLYEKWVATYQIIRDNKILVEKVVEFPWRTLGLDDVACEAVPHGFVFEPLTETLIPSGILRKK